MLRLLPTGVHRWWLPGDLRSGLLVRGPWCDHRHLRRRHTYPGVFPVVHLDHIYYEGKVEVLKVSLPRDRMALIASDHLPLVADLRIGFD